MSKIANIRFNGTLNRWEAEYKGNVLVKNSNPTVAGREYCERAITGGSSRKAQNHGVTLVNIIDHQAPTTALTSFANGGSAEISSEPQVLRATIESEFPINERFMIMEDYVDMVSKRELASTLVTGEGGLGKTYTVMKTLRDTGLKDITKMEIGAKFDGQKGYVVVKGYSTAKGLYRTLYENRNQIIVFDDCDSVLRDPVAVNILKAALDSYDERVVTWNAEGWGGDDDLPKSFMFEGGVIFISNMPKSKIPQAIRSRAMCADVGMTRAEVIERMRVIAALPEFLPDFEDEHKQDALEFVAGNADNPLVLELNLRSLVNVVKTRAAKPDSWKRTALYSMMNG